MTNQPQYYYTIDENRLAQIVELFNNDVDPAATSDAVKAELLADWHNGQEHQEWLDTAEIQEIVNWLAAFYGEEGDDEEEDEIPW